MVMNRGAIILCGGQSTRMGRDKPTLEFGPGETMLQRVVRMLGETVPSDRIVCVAAPGQLLPPLPATTRIAFDRITGGGPLVGLAVGLGELANDADAAFVAACDAPFLTTAFIARMFDLLGEHAIAAPHDGERWHPLAAVYRTDASVSAAVETLLATGKRSLVALLEACPSRRVSLDDFRDVDPHRLSLIACNTLTEYHAALRRAGLPIPSGPPLIPNPSDAILNA